MTKSIRFSKPAVTEAQTTIYEYVANHVREKELFNFTWHDSGSFNGADTLEFRKEITDDGIDIVIATASLIDKENCYLVSFDMNSEPQIVEEYLDKLIYKEERSENKHVTLAVYYRLKEQAFQYDSIAAFIAEERKKNQGENNYTNAYMTEANAILDDIENIFIYNSPL